MADYDRYQEHRGYRGRYRDRDREARLDDRTGMSPGSPGGYRARYEEDRDRYGYREPGYNAYPDESRSFSSEDYGRAPRGGRNYYRSEGERGREGRYDEREYRPGRGYQSYPFSPYQDFYAGPEGYAGPGYSETYGGNQLYEGASDRSLEAYRGQPSGQFAYPYGRGRADRTGYRPGAPYPGHPESREEHRNWWDRAADTVYSWFGDEDARRRHEMESGRTHRGRGPRGYRRSDERIREDVSDRLTDDHWLDASSIEVEVTGGDVVLTGTVRNRDDKRRAEYLAEAVSGVDNVQNNLRVERSDWRTDVSTGATAKGEAGPRGVDGPPRQ